MEINNNRGVADQPNEKNKEIKSNKSKLKIVFKHMEKQSLKVIWDNAI